MMELQNQQILKNKRHPYFLRCAMLAFMLCFGLMMAMPLSSAHAAEIYDKDYVGDMKIHIADFEDTLVHLARWNGLGYIEMITANPDLDPWIPGEGARVILPKRHLLPDAPRQGIVINLPEMHLFLFPPDGSAPEVYSIGVGREGLDTPVGETRITRKKDGPTWRPTERMREEDPSLPVSVPPGPDNPLGTHALYLGWPQYLIHGTNKPYGIGRRISSGCIRMYPEGIKELFYKVPVNTKVSVVDQPIKVGWIDDKMYIEVHPTMDQSLDVEKLSDVPPYELTDDDMKFILDRAGEFKDRLDRDALKQAVEDRSGFPVPILDRTSMPGTAIVDGFQSKLPDSSTPVEGAAEEQQAEAKGPQIDPVLQEIRNLSRQQNPDQKQAQDKNATHTHKTEHQETAPSRHPSQIRPRYSRTIQGWQSSTN